MYAPDLILLDVMMPGMDGLATLDASRKLPGVAGTPMVFFAARTQDEVRQDLLRRGALDVIMKPIEPNAPVEQIRAIWQRFATRSWP
jgi:CheY-like chemotaxis protein